MSASSGVKADTTCVRNPDHGPEVVRALSCYHASGKYSDVKLVCGTKETTKSGACGTVFWCHSLVLSSVSPFLRDLLSSPGQSDDSRCCHQSLVTIHLPEISPEHLRLVLDYIYTGAMFLCANQLAQVLR